MTTENTEKLVLTVSEASRLLRISLGATYEAVRKGTIPSIKIGRRIIIPRNILVKMLGGVSDGKQNC